MSTDAPAGSTEPARALDEHPLTPTADQRVADMVYFPARPGDLRVVHGDWVHYVVTVPRGRSFLGQSRGTAGSGDLSGLDLSGDSLLGGLVVLLLVPAVKLVGRRGRPRQPGPRALKVGVIRVPDPRGWKVDRHRVVRRVHLAKGEDPAATVLALAERAAAGEFVPQD